MFWHDIRCTDVVVDCLERFWYGYGMVLVCLWTSYDMVLDQDDFWYSFAKLCDL
jgi:hypothetical protein